MDLLNESSRCAEYFNNIKEIRKSFLEKELPKNVRKLIGKDNADVYIVGSSHFSEESINDVRYIMDSLKPDYLVIELCPNRANMLLLREQDIRASIENVNLSSMINLHGRVNGVIQYFLLQLTAHVTKQTGLIPGGEFRAGYECALTQKHCHVILGDRKIGITLNRAFHSLTFFKKLRMIFSMIGDFKPITKKDIEDMKETDILERELMEISKDFPELKKILIDERDKFLARSIYDATITNHSNDLELETSIVAEMDESYCRHQPRDMPRVVVAIVGIGHMSGILKAWDTADSIDKYELNCRLKESTNWTLTKTFVKVTAYASLITISMFIFKASLRRFK